MRLHSLHVRIIVSFIILLLLAQALVLGIVGWHALKVAKDESDYALTVAEQTAKNFLNEQQHRFELVLGEIARNAAFKAAVLQNDTYGMVTQLPEQLLLNHLSWAFVFKDDGTPLFSFNSNTQANIGLTGHQIVDAGTMGTMKWLINSQGAPQWVGVTRLDSAHQLAIGVVLDQSFLRSISVASGVHVSLLAPCREGGAHITATSKAAIDTSSPFQCESSGLSAVNLTTPLARARHSALTIPLNPDAKQNYALLLEQSREFGSQVIAQFKYAALVSIFIVTALGTLGGWLLARRVVSPLVRLTDAANQIQGGRYDEKIEISRADEIGQLATTFDLMRQKIAQREKEILRLAYQDSLTGLPNRARFTELLESVLNRAAKADIPVTVIILGLDRFRYINDTLGQAIGDAVLVAVAGRLHALINEQSAVARLGGDEFAFVVSHSANPRAVACSERIKKTLQDPILINGQPLDVSASIGIACYPAHAHDASSLMRHADIAMAAAKRLHVGSMVFEPRDDELRQEHLSMLGELRRAVEENQLQVHYQPKVTLADGEVIGVEALIRWLHPKRGMIPPSLFIGFAEQTGFIREITTWLLPQVMRDCVAWRAQGLKLQAAVNLSTRDLLHRDLPVQLEQMLAAHSLEPEWLSLEITESAMMDDPQLAELIMRRIRQLGIGIAIDDFGTGQASLGYLRNLPVSELKIDQTFTRSLLQNATDVAIVRATIELGHNLGLTMVAEGVETKEHLDYLTNLGCDIAQGYHIARPMPAHAFIEWLKKRQPLQASVAS